MVGIKISALNKSMDVINSDLEKLALENLKDIDEREFFSQAKKNISMCSDNLRELFEEPLIALSSSKPDADVGAMQQLESYIGEMDNI